MPDLCRQSISAGAFERFLTDGDAAALIASAGPGRIVSSTGRAGYPEVHRICDVAHDGRWWRVCRVVDLETCECSLFISEVAASAASTRPGVRYSLQGDALIDWVRDEFESPTKEPPP